ncbi:MAG: hypothetical protein HY754_04505 [Nitrospirae bacterium]|nr:hypothetical protein [Nitrospirota bacterium]
MMGNRDIRQLQKILVMRRLVTYLLLLKYLSRIRAITDTCTDTVVLDEWWEGMILPDAPTGLVVTPGDTQLTVSWDSNTDTVTDTGKEKAKDLSLIIESFLYPLIPLYIIEALLFKALLKFKKRKE